MKAVRRSERPAEQIQPDPMLQERRRGNPIAIGVAAIFALTIVSVVFYGLSREVGPSTVTASGSDALVSTSGQAQTDTSASAPNDKSTTAAKSPQGRQSGGQAQPANQSHRASAGKPGESR